MVPRLTAVPCSIFFPYEDRALDHVVDVCPVADLLTYSPNHEWVLADVRPGNHGNDRMILHARRAET
jgi:hypothetical protein